jgi:uncharacterized protein (TIGR02391 family)
MKHLIELVPSATALLDLEPEELGASIVSAIKHGRKKMTHPGDVVDVVYPRSGIDNVAGFPPAHRQDVELAILEAWSWLEAQGFLVWSDFANGSNGWRRLTRRALRTDYEEFADIAAARALPQELLHQSIRNRVWSDFVRGHFAAKQVEVAVRKAIGAENHRYGVPLMADAFHEENGKLTDREAQVAERAARRNLFMGFIGAYKNPLSHRDVDIDDPKEAIELILMASHLLRIVEFRSATLKPPAIK